VNPIEEILEMARKFISGEDRSMGFIASMEDFVVQHFLDSEVFEFLAEGMSLYRPWAGSPYWTEGDMVHLMEDFVKKYGPPGKS
jgi:hypothetical protein